MYRLTISWLKISEDGCSGVATLDEWDDTQAIIDVPVRSSNIEVSIETGMVSFKNFSKSVFTEEILTHLKDMMTHFFDGVKRKYYTFKWQF